MTCCVCAARIPDTPATTFPRCKRPICRECQSPLAECDECAAIVEESRDGRRD